MQTASFGRGGIKGSRLAYGCWRLAGTWDPGEVTREAEAAGERAVQVAIDSGYTVFDHADIYCHGVCEQIFGRVVRNAPSLRDRLVIITKCGIRRADDPVGAPYRYDFSASYIIWSCEQSLKRLGIETIDIFLLHRPDYLMDPTEVAGAFEQLRRDGKVREFGVSNFSPAQVGALEGACARPLVTNQIEFSLAHLAPLEDGTLDHCLTREMTPMAWSPLAGGKLADGARRLLPSQEAYQTDAIQRELDLLAAEYGTTRTAIALAWLLRHPSGVVPVVGTRDPERIGKAARAADISLTREHWYRLLTIARGERLP